MTSDGKVVWGILGVAKINDRLIPALRQSKTSELLAIASRDGEKALHAAQRTGIPKAFGGYEQLLDDPTIDAVYIPLPNHLHDEWTRKAADRGKHILCEKPLTPDAKSARALVDHCRKRNVRLMDGFMWPHHPRTTAIRELIDEGAIGRVERVDAGFTFQLPLDPKNIRLRPSAGGGSLLDVGCYPVFGICWAFGELPVRVFASAKYEFGVDLSLDGLLWFADGRVARFDCGFTLPLRQTMQISGSKGVISIPQMWVPGPTAEYKLQNGEGPAQKLECPCPCQIVCMVDHFNSSILLDQETSSLAIQAVKTLRVLDAVARAAHENCAVEVESEPEA